MTTKDFFILLLASGLFGAIIGAYYGTIEYRIRQNLELITSKCYCPFCGHELSLFQQVPIISWIALGGRCHYCKSSIPLRYPLAEGSFIIFYMASFLLLHPFPVTMVLSWFLFTALLLIFRCHKYHGGLKKGILIMFVYHMIFGSLIALLLSIL